MNSYDKMIDTVTLQIQSALIRAIGDYIVDHIKTFIIGMPLREADAILDVKGLASYLHVDENWIYQRTRKQEIPFIKKGKYCLFRRSDIDAWLNMDAIKPLSPFASKRK